MSDDNRDAWHRVIKYDCGDRDGRERYWSGGAYLRRQDKAARYTKQEAESMLAQMRQATIAGRIVVLVPREVTRARLRAKAFRELQEALSEIPDRTAWDVLQSVDMLAREAERGAGLR